MITHACPNCGRLLQIRDEYGGKWGRCKYCQGRVLAPTLTISGIERKVYREIDNQGTRLLDVVDANAHWAVLKVQHRVEPGLVYGFMRLIDMQESLLALPCIHVADDSGGLICTEPLTFGYYELNDNSYESVLCGQGLTQELYDLAVQSFERHNGRRKFARAPSDVPTVAARVN